MGLGVGFGVGVGSGGGGGGGGGTGPGPGGAGVALGSAPGGGAFPGGGAPGPGCGAPGCPPATPPTAPTVADGAADDVALAIARGVADGPSVGDGVLGLEGREGHSASFPQPATRCGSSSGPAKSFSATAVWTGRSSHDVTTIDHVNRLSMPTTMAYQSALPAKIKLRLTGDLQPLVPVEGSAHDRRFALHGQAYFRLWDARCIGRETFARPHQTRCVASARDLRFSADWCSSSSTCRPMTGPSSCARNPPGSS